MSEDEKQGVINLLEYFERQFTDLMEFIDNKGQLRGAEKEDARSMLRDLKADLEKTCKDLHRREDELNHYERAFLEPALRKAKANLGISVGSIPGPKWGTQLYGARIDITFMLAQLRGAK
jgi:hypothetical protein